MTVANAQVPSVKDYLSRHTASLVLLAIAGVLILLAQLNFWDYERFQSSRPADLSATIWATPQSTPVPVLEFRSGQPTPVVSLAKFKEMVGAGPYQYYYWEGWTTGIAGPYVYDERHWFVTYQAEVSVGGTRSFLTAYQAIPKRINIDWGWSYSTRFDPRTSQFVSEAATLGTGYWTTGWVLRIIAAAFLSAALAFWFFSNPSVSRAKEERSPPAE